MTRPPGQFYHGIEYEVSDLRPGEVPEKPDATMFVKGQELNVTRYAMCLSQEFSCNVNANEYVLLKYNLVYMTCLSLSTEAGRETSGGMRRTEKTFPAGSFIVMEQACLMEILQITLCQAFLRLSKNRSHINVQHRNDPNHSNTRNLPVGRPRIL